MSRVITRIIYKKKPQAAHRVPQPAVRTLLQLGSAGRDSRQLPALPFHPQAQRKVQKTKLTLSKAGAATTNPKTGGITTATGNSKEAQTNRTATEQL